MMFLVCNFPHGSSYVTTDYFFKAIDIPKWNAEIKTMVDKKADLAFFNNIERGEGRFCSEQANVCFA